ncbi:hypothetical protein JXA47_05290 [Candidatus Sumerlaeota bacterium]|nr:hypothetical protein [Candidatus Sumerlaeota bacterium]
MQEDPQQESPIRTSLPILGIVVIVLGLYLTVMIFFSIVGALQDPSGVSVMLDGWEQAMRGDRAMVQFPATFQLDSTVPLTVSGETTVKTTTQVLRAEGPIEIDLSRLIAIPVVLILLLVLVSIAGGLVKGGIQMVIATPHRKLLEKLIKGLRTSSTIKVGEED